MNSARLLPRVLCEPDAMGELDGRDWECLLVLAGRARLTATLGHRIGEAGLLDAVPQRVRNHFEAAQREADSRARLIRWEMQRLQRALGETDIEVAVLKGGAYLLLELPVARGRLATDLDILVPRSRLAELEALLLDRGWESVKLDDYDQRYYRQWMHEIPPLRHPQRLIEVDVHHTLLPPVARLGFEGELLWSAVRPVPGSRFRVPGAEDLVLHAVVHLFYDSDLDNRLRDLLDIDGLLRFYGGAEGGFWERLLARACRHGLEVPLAHALHYCRRLFATPVPKDAQRDPLGCRRRRWMDGLVTRALLPDPPAGAGLATAAARWLLYVRSHYLRMPLRLLLPHLLHKSMRKAG